MKNPVATAPSSVTLVSPNNFLRSSRTVHCANFPELYVCVYSSTVNVEKEKSEETDSVTLSSIFGVWDSGDPHAAYNDRIDKDLADDYANSHETE